MATTTSLLLPMSDIRIDREGSWFYRGTEMFRQDIVGLFYQHLEQDYLGYFIQIGEQRYRVDVEDTAYVVRAVYWTRSGDKLESVRLLLSDNSVEELDPDTLKIGEENVLYCRVKAGRFDARFLRSSYYRFAEIIRFDPQPNSYFIELNERRHYL
jgi:uncharacterized protein